MTKTRRRDFIARTMTTTLGASLGLPVFLRGKVAYAEDLPRFEGFEHKGMFIRECSLPNETRADDVFPAHPNGIQVSRNRWLILYATRGFRGCDDDRSIVYQLRRNAPDGPIIKEGMLERCIDDWDPFGDGSKYVKQQGHPVGFGVPLGVQFDGKPAAHANLFVVKWRVMALKLDRSTGQIHFDGKLHSKTQAVEWVQVRLNQDQSDIEIVQPVEKMRQKGFATEGPFCSADVAHMNQTFIQAVPFTKDCTQWVDCNHFDKHRVAALKYTYNPVQGLYEWTATGPFLFDRPVFEASIVPYRGRWIITARPTVAGTAWLQTDDPFAAKATPVYKTNEPQTRVPRTLYKCADGVFRLFTADPKSSPYGNIRNPLYFWDVDPDAGFACTNRTVVFDSVKAGLQRRGNPMVGMCKLLAPCGNSQILLHRVAPRVYNPKLAQEDKADFGIYYGRLVFDKRLPSSWKFINS